MAASCAIKIPPYLIAFIFLLCCDLGLILSIRIRTAASTRTRAWYAITLDPMTLFYDLDLYELICPLQSFKLQVWRHMLVCHSYSTPEKLFHALHLCVLAMPRALSSLYDLHMTLPWPWLFSSLQIVVSTRTRAGCVVASALWSNVTRVCACFTAFALSRPWRVCPTTNGSVRVAR